MILREFKSPNKEQNLLYNLNASFSYYCNHGMFEWILKKSGINDKWDKRPAKDIYLICVRRGSDCYEQGVMLWGRKAFYLKIFNLLQFQTWRGCYFLRVFLYLEMVVRLRCGNNSNKSNRLLGSGRLQLHFTSLTSASSYC